MKLSPDDAAASSVPPRADEGPAAPSFPGTPGRQQPEDSPMPQQTHSGSGAAPDETARLAGGPVVGPPPTGAAPAAHGQSAVHGQAPAGAPAPGRPPVRGRARAGPAPARPRAPPRGFAAEPDDTRPVPREWMRPGPDAEQAAKPVAPAAPTVVDDAPAQDWSTEELDGY